MSSSENISITGSKEIIKNLKKIQVEKRKVISRVFMRHIKIYRRKAEQAALQYMDTGFMAARFGEEVSENKPGRVVVRAGPRQGYATYLALWLERGTRERINKKTGKSYGRIIATDFQWKAWVSTKRKIVKLLRRDLFKELVKKITVRRSRTWGKFRRRRGW